MKKMIEAELISLAHRVLKLKSDTDLDNLLKETEQLYRLLGILKFYQENADKQVYNRIENQLKEEIAAKKILSAKEENKKEENKGVELNSNLGNQSTSKAVDTKHLKDKPISKSQKEASTSFQQQLYFEDIINDEFKEPEFEKVVVNNLTEKANTKTVNKESNHSESVDSGQKLESTPQIKSINDSFNKGISIGLNDRIAFEKKLFAGSTQDFNRVLSQLNTFDNFIEAKAFIDDFVKPDYQNWDGKEDFEQRFLELVEKRFNK